MGAALEEVFSGLDTVWVPPAYGNWPVLDPHEKLTSETVTHLSWQYLEASRLSAFAEMKPDPWRDLRLYKCSLWTTLVSAHARLLQLDLGNRALQVG